MIKCTIFQGGFGAKPITKEKDIGVLTERTPQNDSENDQILMEVGIDDLLNIKIHIP